MALTERECDAMDHAREQYKERLLNPDPPEPPQCAHRGEERCEEDAGHRGRHTYACDDSGCCEPIALDAEAVADLRWHHFGEGR